MGSNKSINTTTVIVGGGIVGSALAAFLSEDTSSGRIILVDRSFSEVLGSTAYAPGFLGQYNQSEALTKLAVDSLNAYEQFPEVFERASGLEFALTDAGICTLGDRCEKANTAGIPARLLRQEELSTIVPSFVDGDSFKQALYFPTDGVADPKKLCLLYRQMAKGNGVEFLEATVTGPDVQDGVLRGLKTEDGTTIQASRVIFATGIWTSSLLSSALKIPVPTVPVAHPYVYTAPVAEIRKQSPFCRWPESHVYARDHGDRYGLGSYDHAPMRVLSLDATASKVWPVADFAPVISHAASSKVASTSELSMLTEMKDLTDDESIRKINGIFSVTPDSLPLLGRVPGLDNCWLAAGIWITHAAGCARLLMRMIQGEAYDQEIASSLDPARFAAGDVKHLEATALKQYNDIYLTKLTS